MKRHLILMLIVMCCINSTFAAEKEGEYKIEISAPQLKNKTINLGVHFYGKLYSRDTITLDAKGNGTFMKKKHLQEGMYAIYFSKSNFFDILVSENQQFKIKIDTTDLVNKTFITGKGADETIGFNNYIKFICSKRTEVDSIVKKYEKTKNDPETKKIIKEKTDPIDKEVLDYQKQIATQYSSKTLGVFLKALTPIDIPTFEAKNDSALQIKQYYYNKAHYFDNVDLSDPRLLYSGFLNQKIDYFIDKIVPQIPDTITTEVVNLIEKSKGDTLTFQNMTSNMLNYALKSKMMGMDRLTLTIAEKYYLSGQATWADSTLLKDLKKEVQKTKYNQIGAKAANLTAENLKGDQISLYNLPADYILLFFFEPTCGHCKKETPILYDTVYQKYKNKGFEVFAFYTQTNRKEWEDFINEHKLYDWVNVWDPKRESYFWIYYDTTTTPGVYLLNKERKIIAKKIDLETLDLILGKEIGKEDNTTKK
jgi:peroxiredoxin